MNKRVGLWFNLKKAVIVTITDSGEEITRITSTMEHYARFSKSIPGDGTPEDARDRRFWTHVDEYYDRVIAHIQDARTIQLFGPGDDKLELEKRLVALGLPGQIDVTDSPDGLTDLQVAKRVRAYFPARSQFDLS